MKVPAMIAAELRRLTATRMASIALVALMIVPILYGGLYLWANQDPYAKFSEVPVALVVADRGVDASGDQPAENFGQDVANTLLEGRAFDWRTMTDAEASTALKKGTVEFSVTIPADFSEALSSAAGNAPRQADLLLETNDANNYLASTIGSQAIEKIRASVTETVNKQAALRLLDGLAEIRTKLVTAADGASRLADGAQSATDGATRLHDGATQLATGTASLASGAHGVADGARTLQSGASQVAGGASQVASGAAQVADGTAQLAQKADQIGAVVGQAEALVPKVRSDIEQALAAQGLTPTQIAGVLGLLDPLGDRVTQAGQTVQGQVAQIDRLAAGAAQVSSGAAQVSSGASQLQAGATRLADGSAQLASGADTAAAGASQLASGSGDLQSGLETLTAGANELRDGLREGVAQIPDSSAETREAQASTISNPINVSSGKLAAASDYGAGLAPFFVALAGWIGIYALFLIVKPISKRAITALRIPVRITLAGWLTPALLGAVQMLALFGVLALALGFTFANPLPTLGIMALASLTYAAIILCLNVWLGSVGQFLGLVLMVLQLVTAGGTFPWQTLPGPLQGLHFFFPMGYVVDAMRQLMYGGDIARVSGDVTVLLIWLVGALALASIGVTRMVHTRTLRDLQPSLIG